MAITNNITTFDDFKREINNFCNDHYMRENDTIIAVYDHPLIWKIVVVDWFNCNDIMVRCFNQNGLTLLIELRKNDVDWIKISYDDFNNSRISGRGASSLKHKSLLYLNDIFNLILEHGELVL